MDKLLQIIFALVVGLFFLYGGIKAVFFNKIEAISDIEAREASIYRVFGTNKSTGKKRNES